MGDLKMSGEEIKNKLFKITQEYLKPCRTIIIGFWSNYTKQNKESYIFF